VEPVNDDQGRDRAGRRLRIGVVGLGRAFTLMLPAFLRHPRVQLVAGADVRSEARDQFASEFSARTYETASELCGDERVEAVYVATPHQFHQEHVVLAAKHGKHVLVEKPMALTLEESRRMVDAARSRGTHLIVGHSHSFSAPYIQARAIIESGVVGRIRMITALNFTDYVYRPRRPEELVTDLGGGVVFGQAPHHIDIVRLLGGGLAHSVRSLTGRWDAQRGTEGAYAALITFEDGAFATATYSGYGHFDSDELQGWVGEMGQDRRDRSYGASRKLLQRSVKSTDEASLKSARTYGAAGEVRSPLAVPEFHNHFGFVLASCERADLRPTPHGVHIYGDDTETFRECPPPRIPRGEVLDELCDAALLGVAPVHSGEWGMATLEVCLAMLKSAAEGREVRLAHQIGLPARQA
jgi:phthalate 4,5-cis-dihydrodiol dehydrogenase